MNITIIGASAGIGREAVKQALEKGHAVTAFSRDTSGIPDHALLTKINGSATSASDLEQAMTNAEAVLVTIGTKDKKGTTLFTDTARALIIAATKLHLEAPVLVITGFGAGASSRYLGFFMRTVIRLFLKDQYRNKTQMEELIAESMLNWEIVRPGMLTNGPLTNNVRVLPELHRKLRVGKVSRADVADFLLREAEAPTLLQRYPALTY